MQTVAAASRTDRPVFELCAETVASCLAACDGGADRIELCADLDQDGLTPSHSLIDEALRLSGLPVHVLLRPRPGDFLYTPAEFNVLERQLLDALDCGAAGVVLGLLRPDHTVDVDRTAALVALAAPHEVTFHRAFDRTPSLPDALEAVLHTGCHRILTSGGAPDVVAGARVVRGLVQQAAGRIAIAAGGGLRLHNAAAVAHATHAPHFHGSLRSHSPGALSGPGALSAPGPVSGPRPVRAADIRSLITELTHGMAMIEPNSQ